MAPNGNIYYPKGTSSYSENFFNADIHKQATFIHELGHVWQYQIGISVKMRGILERSYDYLPMTASSVFFEFGIEQQAQIIRDYFYLLNGFSNPAWPSIDTYKAVIPFII